MRTDTYTKVQNLTLLALLTALVAVLQLMGQFIRLGMFSVSLVLVPIVLGAALLGPLAGAWLGLAFGVTVLISGDAATFLGISFAGTIITVLVKGLAAGLVSGLVFKALEKKNSLGAIITSAVVCPFVNTGVFLIGCFLFFFDAVALWAQDKGQNVFIYMIVVLVGGNFIFEVIFNIVLAPAIHRLIAVGKKTISRKHLHE